LNKSLVQVHIQSESMVLVINVQKISSLNQSDPIIYLEVSDLLRRLNFGLPLDGITRVTLLALKTLTAHYGEHKTRLLVFDTVFSTFREMPTSVITRRFKTLGNIQSKTVLTSNTSKLSPFFWPFAKPRPHDVMFYTGNWWWRPKAFQVFERLKNRSGAKVIVFLHDLIPIVRSEYVDVSHARRFGEMLRQVCAVSNLILTNSMNSRSDILAWMHTSSLSNIPIEFTPLPHEFFQQPNYKANIWGRLSKRWIEKRHTQSNAEFKGCVGGEPFVLTVGTIELRKNVPALLRAWEKLQSRKQKILPWLVLVGKWGQGAEEIKELINQFDGSEKKIHVLNHVSDEMLVELYRGCLFSIYVSQYEGWGLPIGESLWFGKRVLASNTSAMTEAGEDLVLYVDPNDHQALVDGLHAMISDPNLKELRDIDQNRLRKISQFGDSLCSALDGCIAR
jgi:glycosyltransferase involved in cell wall biosynthesis